MGELEKGIAKHRDGVRRKRLRAFVEGEIVERFGERILPTDAVIWRRWGVLSGTAEREGSPLPVLDALLASVAQVHGLTVVTRNEVDFVRCEVPVLNPWSDASR